MQSLAVIVGRELLSKVLPVHFLPQTFWKFAQRECIVVT